jgi:outer membrane lipoprotein SlyB
MDNLAGTRASPLIAIAVVSVMVLGVIGVAAVTGVLPNGTSQDLASSARIDAPRTDAGAPSRAVACALCGTVEAIRIVEVVDEAGGATLADAGRDGGATILGSSGSAASGNEIAQGARRRYAYRVTVRMDDGSYRTVSLAAPPALAVGDKVRVVEGKLVRA